MSNTDDVLERFKARQEAKPPKQRHKITISFTVDVEKQEFAEEIARGFAQQLLHFSDVKSSKIDLIEAV